MHRYQNDATGEVDAVEVVVQGCYKKVDMGTAKPGEETNYKYTMPCSYDKLAINNEVIYEFDFVAGTANISCVSQNSDLLKTIGL